jgi:hypothetical protein
MVDEIQRASSSLKELNDNALAGEKIFSGFLGTMVEVAAGTEGASKAWTTLSRLTSGSPIWKLQNKARAYLSILAGFQERALRAENAQRMQNKAAVDAILNADKLKLEYMELVRTFSKVNMGIGEYTSEQEAALQSTVAFSEAIMAGKSKNEAYGDSLISLRKLTMENSKEVRDFLKVRKKAAKFEENLQTAKGRGRIKAGIQSQKRKAYSMLTGEDSRKKDTSFGMTARDSSKGFGKALKGVFIGSFSKGLKDLNALRKNGNSRKKIMDTYITMRTISSKFAIGFQKRMLKVVMSAGPLLTMAFKGFVFLILGVIAFMVFAKVAYDIFNTIKDFGAFDNISNILTSVVSIIGKIFSVVGAFIEGDFTAMLDYLSSIVSDIIDIALNAALAATKIGFGILVGAFYSLIDFVDYALLQGNFFTVIAPLLLKIGAVLLVAYFVKYMIAQALLLVGIYALPILIGVVVLAALVAIYRKFEGSRTFKLVATALTFALVVGAFLIGLPAIIGVLIGALIIGIARKFNPFKKAMGGTSHGGMTLVGEQGPELVNLPAGAQVKTNSQTNRMMGGTTVNNYITINAKDTSKAEMRRIATELGNMINTKMNRTGATRTMR